ncbi:MAG: thioredoxin-dependent thiol peroxidase [Rhodospirillales bacterium]|jgi:peroxiredoxin Q/BCP|nr:thioredoxin-dependent thiol peroxidase [Rhodospirillales bacterium]
MSLDVGDSLPDFALPTDNGGTVSAADLRGRRAVIYFYPKDDTSGCTKEAQAFRDAADAFAAAGVTVIGVSPDGVASHDKFKAKHGLNFTLAADVDKRAAEAFGVWVEKSMYGKKYMGVDRSTFLIDESGRVRKAWRKVKVPGHVEDVLAAARGL